MGIGSVFFGFIAAVAVVIPIICTVSNIVSAVRSPENMYRRVSEYIIGGLTVVSGIAYTAYFAAERGIMFLSDWDKTLVNMEKHTPIFTGSYPLILTLFAVSVAAYILLRVLPVYKVPPLITVGLLAMLYIGIILLILWIIQVQPLGYEESPDYASPFIDRFFTLDWFLILFPVNLLLFCVKLIRYKIYEWNHPKKEKPEYNNRILALSGKVLEKAERWPIYAFLLMLPLLCILLLILMLFGQRPDMIIRAWTETSGWTFSKMQSPPNLHADGHYLCTVAAGGHKKLVKPKRMGIRHGHRIVVNRQLLISNAFEQILEERTPKFHRIVRNFYDKYGFPVAHLIKSRIAADVVYILMKPAEWLFLLVLYLTDTEPENRISMQYIPPINK